jgi:hypothetical protein
VYPCGPNQRLRKKHPAVGFERYANVMCLNHGLATAQESIRAYASRRSRPPFFSQLRGRQRLAEGRHGRFSHCRHASHQVEGVVRSPRLPAGPAVSQPGLSGRRRKSGRRLPVVVELLPVVCREGQAGDSQALPQLPS